MTPAEFILTQAAREAAVTDELTNRFTDEAIRTLHMSMGVCTEGGELLDAVKKMLFYGKKLDRTNVIEEMGDVLWYLAGLCRLLDVSFEEVMAINDAKLELRYGPAFTTDKAINRDLVAERALLQGDCETPADMDDDDDLCDDPTDVWEAV